MSTERKEIPLVNPAPLGLLSFGLTTVLLNLHNVGIIPLSIVIVAMGLAVGGFSQVVAGIFEFKVGSTFGGIAFVSYGCFWWSLCLIWMNPFGGIAAADGTSLGFYLLLWGIYSAFMFVGTLTHTRALQVVFFTVIFLFLFLAVADFTGNHTIKLIGGWVGILCGGSAIYNAVAQIVNGEHKRTLLPVGPPKK